MKYIFSLTIALVSSIVVAPACDPPSESTETNVQVDGVVGELQVCVEGPNEEAISCVKDVLAGDLEDGAKDESFERVEGSDLFSIGEVDPESIGGSGQGPKKEEKGVSCSSKDGAVDCWSPVGKGCCRSETKCWPC